MLVLSWKLGAENMGYYKLNEWKIGMTSIEYVVVISLLILFLTYPLNLLIPLVWKYHSLF